MALKFRPVQKHPSEMTAPELRRLLGDLPDSQVMRTLLIAEVEAIRKGAPRERRTMRNVWYDVVKPALSRAGILNKTTKGGRAVPWPDKMSDILGELVENKHATYEALRIVDGSRQRQVAISITQPVARVNLVGAHFPWVILFSEKDTIWGEIEGLASLYGISAISGGGQPSFACTENTIREIVRHPVFRKAQPERIVILSLTDYDPFGYHIAESIYEQVVKVKNCIDASECPSLKVKHERLGLLPGQLTPEERQAKAYEPKDEGLEDWLKKTGGVDGRKLGLELDALPLSRLRSMFAEGIERHVDLEKRRQDLREAYVDLLACELLQPEFDAKRKALRDGIEAVGLWAVIEQTPMPSNLFRQAAMVGWSSINPVKDVKLFSCEHEVRAAMGETLQAFGQNGG